VKLPDFKQATIPKAKITDYLLSMVHRDGRSKAVFFNRYGFLAENWQALAQALLKHAEDNSVYKIEDTPFGKRFIIEGPISAPDGRKPLVRSIWFVEEDESTPKFVTAYPLKRSTR
jgi:hypothetical protein